MTKARLHIKDAQGKYVISTCTLCGLCAKACPTGAIKVNVELGRLELDEKKCTGCGKCIEVCPTGVLKLDERSKPLICDRCQGDPQCAKWCPVEAIIAEVY
jgi:ferredoxin